MAVSGLSSAIFQQIPILLSYLLIFLIFLDLYKYLNIHIVEFKEMLLYNSVICWALQGVSIFGTVILF